MTTQRNAGPKLDYKEAVIAQASNGDIVYTRLCTQLELVDAMAMMLDAFMGMMVEDTPDGKLNRMEKMLDFMTKERELMVRVKDAKEAARNVDPGYASR